MNAEKAYLSNDKEMIQFRYGDYNGSVVKTKI